MKNKSIMLQKINNLKNMPALIAEALKEQILRGEIEGGTQLKQEELAKQFNVSLIPIREAIIQLESQGLVQCIRNKGAIVTELSINEMEQIFDLRSILEVGAIRQAIPNMKAEHFIKAEYLIEQMKHETDPYRWSRLNWLFHEVLYISTNNNKIISVIEDLFVSIQRYTVLLFGITEDRSNAHEGHAKIIDACKNKDISGAASLIENHISTYKNILKDHMD